MRGGVFSFGVDDGIDLKDGVNKTQAEERSVGGGRECGEVPALASRVFACAVPCTPRYGYVYLIIVQVMIIIMATMQSETMRYKDNFDSLVILYIPEVYEINQRCNPHYKANAQTPPIHPCPAPIPNTKHRCNNPTHLSVCMQSPSKIPNDMPYKPTIRNAKLPYRRIYCGNIAATSSSVKTMSSTGSCLRSRSCDSYSA